MGDYLLICRAPSDPHASRLFTDLRTRASAEGYVVTPINAHAWLGVRGPCPPKRVDIGGWVLIGDVFDRRSPRLPYVDPQDPWAFERKLVARVWGRYAGVLFGPKDQPAAFIRDPSGALECVAWTHCGLTVACSAADDWLVRCLRPRWQINYDRVADALHSLVAGTGELLLDGPHALEPGTVQPTPLTVPPIAVWTPRQIAMQSLDPSPAAQAEFSIRSAVEEAVSRLSNLPGPLTAEVSGGLDSSIVAAALARGALKPVSLWINAYGATPESDERSYVEILGDALGFKPHCTPHAVGPLTSDWLTALAGGFRPGLNALDHPQNLRWASLLHDHGAKAVMTGKGGDSILFQAATTDVFTDQWLTQGWRALTWPDLTELAAANELSVWSMVRTARRYELGKPDPLLRDHPILGSLDRQPPPHPWLRDLEAFGPAKCFHIAGVADSVSHHNPSSLTQAVDVRHPLCAQPVVEACLALPTAQLSVGGRDRGLARRAFRNQLPTAIVDRRTKGEMTRIYGRMVSENLNILRPWLADGRLASCGIIDRERVLAELSPEVLIWRGQHAAVLTAAAFEGWVRRWERRLT